MDDRADGPNTSNSAMNTSNPSTSPPTVPSSLSASPVTPVAAAPKRSRGFNIPAPVAILLVLLLAAGAGWYVYTELFPPKIDITQYDVPTAGGYAPRRTMGPMTTTMNPAVRNNPTSAAEAMKNRLEAAGATPGVGAGMFSRADGFDLRIPGARARLSRSGATWKTDIAYTDVNYIPLTDRWAALARWNAMDAARASAAKLTPEQVAKLKEITFPREMAISDADRARLVELVPAYQKAGDADKPAAEKALVDAFREIAIAAIVPSQAAHNQAAEKVREVLNREQLNALRGG
ncbi:MAG: hypothetical protein H7144_10170 [Burkholderiales bacterium]|nr:hypothetical protein [Phycisphaerae bacterium]